MRRDDEKITEKLKGALQMIQFTGDPVKRKMRVFLSLAVALILIAAVVIIILLTWLLVALSVVTTEQINDSIWFVLIAIATASILLGSFFTYLAGRWVLKPFNRLVDGLSELSKGNYAVRLDNGKNQTIASLSGAFNHLAVELEKTEILRSDFVNNFSHELKTPISSIKGLVSLAKMRNLSREKQIEYLTVIEEEADRLTGMTTNILNLSKVESQGILTNCNRFNLSEQIRTCVLLFEKQWTQKNLLLDVEFDEYELFGNEDMFKQVWINLIGNACKFADCSTRLKISIDERMGYLSVSVTSEGVPIAPEEKERIFQKFYRADSNVKREGNGIGLSIVKHIVDLHNGVVEVDVDGRFSTFTVILPK